MALAVAALRSAAAAGPSSCNALQAARGWLCTLLSQPSDMQQLTASSARRSQHIMTEQREQPVVPEAILKELRELDASLYAASRLDGRKRSTLPLTASSLPAPLPAHALEPGLPSLDALVRPEVATGKGACKWLRKMGRVPGRIFSLPAVQQQQQQQQQQAGEAQAGNAEATRGRRQGQGGGGAGGGSSGWRSGELLLHFDERDIAKMIRSYGRIGCTARVLQVNVLAPPAESGSESAPAAAAAAQPAATDAASSSPSSSSGAPQVLASVRVKPLQVYMNAVSQRVEGLDLLYCPQDRVVQVDVPVRLLNDDLAPGVRKGGWMAMSKRTIRYKALGSAIPPYIEVNVRHLELEQELLVRDMPIPPGTKIYEKDYNAPVLRCTIDVGKD